MPRGVRLNPKHDERTRAKIQTSQIINRLNGFVNGKVDMNSAQVTAALGLLKKTLPDLQSIEMGGPGGNPIEFKEITDKERAKALALVVMKMKALATAGE